MKTIQITLPNPCDKEHDLVQAIYHLHELCVSHEVREATSICLTVPYTNTLQLLHVLLSVVHYSQSSHYAISIR